jgi:hypothetical protein
MIPSQYNGFAPQRNTSCANGACGSDGCSKCAASPLNPAGVAPLADEFARILPYGWLQRVGGEQYGTTRDWYTSLGLFAPLLIFEGSNTVAFLQASGMLAQESTYGANVGIGFRRRHLEADGLYGASLWYDLESDSSRTFQQIGISFESLFNNLEVRANGYVPVSSGTHIRSATPRFIGNNIHVGTRETALTGFDLEAGMPVAGLCQLWAFGGYYFYTDRDSSLTEDPIHGLTGRLELRPKEDVAFSLTYAYDEVFESSLFGGVTIPLRSIGQIFSSDCECTLPRYGRLVNRRNRLAIHRSDAIATNAVTGNPVFVAQVDSAAPAGGDGTPDAPFQTIGDAVTAADQHGIVFVRNGTFNETVSLQNNQRLLADGFLDSSPYQVVSREGTFILPGQRTRVDVTMPVISSSDPLGTIQLCRTGQFVDNAEVAGFAISNTAGSSIFGVLNNGVSIRENVIGPSAGYGIGLLNASGLRFANSTAPASASGIFNNVIDQNVQGGILLADVDLSAFDLNPLGSDLNTKGIPLVSRGLLAATVSGNTITNNATASTGSGLLDELQNQTMRYDVFGVYVASVTDSAMTIAFDENTIRSNGLPLAAGGTDSTGGIGILAGGTSRIVSSIEDSTFQTNNGIDIHGIVGDGPTTSSSARLDINIDRNQLTSAQLAQTEDGILATGIRLVADTGTLNAFVNSNVIEGDPTILSATYDRMTAIYSTSQSDAALSTVLGTNGLNVNGGSGNEIRNWHIGVEFDTENSSQGTLNIRDAIIDAQCILKLHTGEDLDLAANGIFNATIENTLLIASLSTTDLVDAIFIDALGASQASLTMRNVDTRFTGPIPTTAPNRQWLDTHTADSGILTISLDNVTALNPHTGFQDFIEIEARDDSRTNLNLTETIVGVTQQFGIDAFATDDARVVLDIVNSTFNGNGQGLINGLADFSSTMTSTVTGSNFTTNGEMAIQFNGNSSFPPGTIQLGATLENNTFIASPASVDIIGIATRGNTLARVNLINNNANGSFRLTQSATPPATSTFELFDDGNNTPAVTTSGTITNSPTLLDITFP